MSVKVTKLVKKFADQIAVNSVSFECSSGSIVGFLGPNGAGKSTTMKLITGYLKPDSGSVLICDEELTETGINTRKYIGYLPENNPLYKDMYILEYLGMIAGIHNIKNKSQRIKDVITQTGLNSEQHKKIGQLSKGYRQRVGLAQAILHDPEILILDEPTSGLDPNQLIEIRNLIKTLGKEKTVIFSSHILQEVQAICDRVLIINHGELVADRTIEEVDLDVGHSRCLYIEFQNEMEVSIIRNIRGVQEARENDSKKFKVYFDNSKDIRKDIFDMAVAQSNRIMEMRFINLSIEDIFKELTN